MDFLKNIANNDKSHGKQNQEGHNGGGGGGIMGKINGALGGGESGEKKEGKHLKSDRYDEFELTNLFQTVDGLDKGEQHAWFWYRRRSNAERHLAVDFFQEHVLKAGPQHNESAVEQAKDEHISDAIRSGFKSVTGKDFPIADK